MWRFPSFLILAAAGAALVASPVVGEERSDDERARVGSKIYLGYCASCHGRSARGDGPVAEHLEVKPSDLARISQRNDGVFPYERIYRIIDGREDAILAHGTREMPIWGEVFRAFSFTEPGTGELAVRRKIGDLIHFLMSIQDPYEKPDPA